jgi:hypothetical protein
VSAATEQSAAHRADAEACMNGADEKTIATLRYGQREELRITAIDRYGKRTIKLRSWFMAKDGQYRPGKDGMRIQADVVDDVLQRSLRQRRVSAPDVEINTLRERCNFAHNPIQQV